MAEEKNIPVLQLVNATEESMDGEEQLQVGSHFVTELQPSEDSPGIEGAVEVVENVPSDGSETENSISPEAGGTLSESALNFTDNTPKYKELTGRTGQFDDESNALGGGLGSTALLGDINLDLHSVHGITGVHDSSNQSMLAANGSGLGYITSRMSGRNAVAVEDHDPRVGVMRLDGSSERIFLGERAGGPSENSAYFRLSLTDPALKMPYLGNLPGGLLEQTMVITLSPQAHNGTANHPAASYGLDYKLFPTADMLALKAAGVVDFAVTSDGSFLVSGSGILITLIADPTTGIRFNLASDAPHLTFRLDVYDDTVSEPLLEEISIVVVAVEGNHGKPDPTHIGQAGIEADTLPGDPAFPGGTANGPKILFTVSDTDILESMAPSPSTGLPAHNTVTCSISLRDATLGNAMTAGEGIPMVLTLGKGTADFGPSSSPGIGSPGDFFLEGIWTPGVDGSGAACLLGRLTVTGPDGFSTSAVVYRYDLDLNGDRMIDSTRLSFVMPSGATDLSLDIRITDDLYENEGTEYFSASLDLVSKGTNHLGQQLAYGEATLVNGGGSASSHTITIREDEFRDGQMDPPGFSGPFISLSSNGPIISESEAVAGDGRNKVVYTLALTHPDGSNTPFSQTVEEIKVTLKLTPDASVAYKNNAFEDFDWNSLALDNAGVLRSSTSAGGVTTLTYVTGASVSFNRLTGDITVTMPPGTGNIKLSMKPLDDHFGGVENGTYFPESQAFDNPQEKFTLEIVGVKGNEVRANSGLSVDTIIQDDGIGSGMLDGPRMGLVVLNKDGTVSANTDTEVRVGENVGYVEFRLFAEGGYSPILAEDVKVLVKIGGTAMRVADVADLDSNDLTGTLDYAFDFSSLPAGSYALVSLGGGEEGIVFTFPAGTNVSSLTFKAYINLDLVDEPADTLLLSIQEVEGNEAGIGTHDDVAVKIFDLSVRPYLTQFSDEVLEGGTATYTINLIHKTSLAAGQFDPAHVADMLVIGDILTEPTIATCKLTLGEASWDDIDWVKFQADNPRVSLVHYDDIQNVVTFTVTIPAGNNQFSITIVPKDDHFGGSRDGVSPWGLTENVENDSPFEAFQLEILTISGNEAQLITHTADGDALTKLETKIVDDGYNGGALDGPHIGVMIDTGTSLVAAGDAVESDNDATVVHFRLVDVNASNAAKDFAALETLSVAVKFGGTGKYGPANISAAGEPASGDYVLDTAALDAFKAGHAGFDYTFNATTYVLILTLPKDMKLSDVPISVKISQDPYTDDGDTITATVVDVEGNEASVGSAGATVTIRDDDPGLRAVLSVDKTEFYESAGVGGDATSHQATYTISLKDGNNAPWNPANRVEDVTVSLKVTLGDTAYGDIDWAKFQADNPHITDFSYDSVTKTITFKATLGETQQSVDFVLTAKEDFFGGTRNGTSGYGLAENVANDSPRETFTIAIVGITGNEVRYNGGTSSSVGVTIIDDGYGGGALDGPQIGVSIVGHGATHSVTEAAGSVQFGLTLDGAYAGSVAGGKTVETLSVVLQVGGTATYGVAGSFGVGSATDYTFDFSGLPAGVTAAYNAGRITLTIAAGVAIADVKFAATLNNDTRTEATPETISLTVVDVEGNEASVAGSVSFTLTVPVGQQQVSFSVTALDDLFGGSRNGTSPYFGEVTNNDRPTETFTIAVTNVVGNEAKIGNSINGQNFSNKTTTIIDDGYNGGALDGPHIGVMIDTGTSLVAAGDAVESDNDATVVHFRLVDVNASNAAKDFTALETLSVAVKFGGTGKYGPANISAAGETASGDYALDTAALDAFKVGHAGFDFTFNATTCVLILTLPKDMKLSDVPVSVKISQDPYTDDGDTIIATVVDVEGNEASIGSGAVVTIRDDDLGMRAVLSVDKTEFYESAGVGGDATSHQATYTISLKDGNNAPWNPANRTEDVVVNLKVTLGDTAYGDIDWAKFQADNPHITDFSYDSATKTITFKATLGETQQSVDFVLTAKEDFFGGMRNGTSGYGLAENVANDSPRETFTIAIVGITGNEVRYNGGVSSSVGVTIIDDGHNGGALDGPQIGVSIVGHGAAYSVTEAAGSVQFGLTLDGAYAGSVANGKTVETLTVVVQVGGTATYGAAGSFGVGSITDYTFDFSGLPAGVTAAYNAGRITLTIPAGVAIADVTFAAALNNDTRTEATAETISLTVVDVEGNEASVAGSGAAATLTVTDDDPGFRVVLGADKASMYEGPDLGNATVYTASLIDVAKLGGATSLPSDMSTVLCDASNRSETVRVTLTLTFGTAGKDDIDWVKFKTDNGLTDTDLTWNGSSSMSFTLTVPVGQQQVSFSVTALDDLFGGSRNGTSPYGLTENTSNDSPAETFTVAVTNVVGNEAKIGSSINGQDFSNATTTIIDDGYGGGALDGPQIGILIVDTGTLVSSKSVFESDNDATVVTFRLVNEKSGLAENFVTTESTQIVVKFGGTATYGMMDPNNAATSGDYRLDFDWLNSLKTAYQPNFDYSYNAVSNILSLKIPAGVAFADIPIKVIVNQDYYTENGGETITAAVVDTEGNESVKGSNTATVTVNDDDHGLRVVLSADRTSLYESAGVGGDVTSHQVTYTVSLKDTVNNVLWDVANRVEDVTVSLKITLGNAAYGDIDWAKFQADNPHITNFAYNAGTKTITFKTTLDETQQSVDFVLTAKEDYFGGTHDASRPYGLVNNTGNDSPNETFTVAITGVTGNETRVDSGSSTGIVTTLIDDGVNGGALDGPEIGVEIVNEGAAFTITEGTASVVFGVTVGGSYVTDVGTTTLETLKIVLKVDGTATWGTETSAGSFTKISLTDYIFDFSMLPAGVSVVADPVGKTITLSVNAGVDLSGIKIKVWINDDEYAEGSGETLSLKVVDVVGNEAQIAAGSTAVLTIEDNMTGPHIWVTCGVSVVEGENLPFTLHLDRVPIESLTVYLKIGPTDSTTDVDATRNVDYILTQLQASLDVRYGAGVVQVLGVDTATGNVQIKIPVGAWHCADPLGAPNDFSMSFDIKTQLDTIVGEPKENIQVAIVDAIGSEVRVGDAGFDVKATGTIAEKTLILTITGDTRVYESAIPHQGNGSLIGSDTAAGIGGGTGDGLWNVASYFIDLTEKLGGADNSNTPLPIANGSSPASAFTFDVQLNNGSAAFCSDPANANHQSGSNDFSWAINGTIVSFNLATAAGQAAFLSALNASGMLPPGVTVVGVTDGGRTLKIQIGTDYAYDPAHRITLQVATIDDGVKENDESYSIAIKSPSAVGTVDADGSAVVNVAIGEKHTINTIIKEDVAPADFDGYALTLSNVSGYETDGYVYLEIRAQGIGGADSGPPVQAITIRLDYGSATDTAKPYINYAPNETYILQPGGGKWIANGDGSYTYLQKISLTNNALSDPNTTFTVDLVGVEGNESRVANSSLGDTGSSCAKVTIIADTKDVGHLDGPSFLGLSLSSILQEPGYPQIPGDPRAAYNEFTYSITLSGPASEAVVTWLKLEAIGGAEEGADFTLGQGIYSVAHWQLYAAAIDKTSVPGLTAAEIAAFRGLDGKSYVSLPAGATHLSIISTTQQNGMFNIRINHDNKTEPDEKLSWTILDMQGSEIVFTGHTPLINPIYDDGEGPKISLSADPSQYNTNDGHVVDEAAGFAKYVMTFTEPAGEPVTVYVKLVYQITNWLDFVATYAEVATMLTVDVPGATVIYDSAGMFYKVTLPAGTTVAHLKLPILDEDAADGDKTFLLRIVGSDGRGEASFDPTPVTTLLRDNDEDVVIVPQKWWPAATVGISANLADMTFEEGNGSDRTDITDKYSIDVTNIRCFNRDINIYIQGSDNTALVGENYEIIGDYVGGARDSYKLTLTGDELKHYVQDMFDADPATYGNYEIKYMTFPPYDEDTSPSWHTFEDGWYVVSKTSFYPEDGGIYNRVMPVSIKVGLDTFGTIQVNIIGNDTLDAEEYKDFSLVVSGVDSAYRAGLEKSKVDTNIHDDDYVPSQIKLSWGTSTSIDVTEKIDAFANFRIVIEQDGGSEPALTRDLVLKVIVRSGTATANEDFAAAGTMEPFYDTDGITILGYEYVRYLTIPKGTVISSGYIENLNVAIADDYLSEGSEDFKIIVEVFNRNGMPITDNGTIKPGSLDEADRTTVVTIHDNPPSRLVRIDKLTTWDVKEGASTQLGGNATAAFSVSILQAAEEDTFVLIKIANTNPAVGEAGLRDLGQIVVDGKTSITFSQSDIDNARVLTTAEFADWKSLPAGVYQYGAECFLKLAIAEGTSSSRITIRTRDDTLSEVNEVLELKLHEVAKGEARIDTSADTANFTIIEDEGDGLIFVIEQPTGAAGIAIEGETATFHVALSRKYDGVNDFHGSPLDEDVDVSFLVADKNLHLIEPGTKAKISYYDGGVRVELEVTIEADGSFDLRVPRTVNVATGIDVTFQLQDNFLWDEDIGFNLSITNVTGGESFAQTAPGVGCALNLEFDSQMRYAITAGASSNADVEYSIIIGHAATLVDGQTLEYWFSHGSVLVYDADNRLMSVRIENDKLMVDGGYAKGESLATYIRIDINGTPGFTSEMKEIIRDGIGAESRLSSHLTIIDDHNDGPQFAVIAVTATEAEGNSVFFDLALDLPAGEITSREGYVATFTLSGAVNLSLPGTLPVGVTGWTLTDNGDGTWTLVATLTTGLADGTALHLGILVGDNLFAGSQDLRIELSSVVGTGTDLSHYERPSIISGSESVNIIVTDEAWADQDGPEFSLVGNSVQVIEGTSLSFNVKVDLPAGDPTLREGYDLTLKLSGAVGLSLPGARPSGIGAWALTDNHDGTYTLVLRIVAGAASGTALPIILNVADNAFVGTQNLSVEITGIAGLGPFHYEKPEFNTGVVTIDIVDEDPAHFDGPSFALVGVPTSIVEGTTLSFSLSLGLPLSETTLHEAFDVSIDVSGIPGITLSGGLPAGISAWSLIGNTLTLTVAKGCAAGNIALSLDVPDNYRAGNEVLSLGITGVTGKAMAGEYTYETSTVNTAIKTVDVTDEPDFADRDGPSFTLLVVDSQIEEGSTLSFAVVVGLPSGNSALQETFELTLTLTGAEGLSLPATLPAGISAWSLTGNGPYTLSLTIDSGLADGTNLPLVLNVADNVFAGNQALDISITDAVGQGGTGDFKYERAHFDSGDILPVTITDESPADDGPQFVLQQDSTAIVEGEELAFDLLILLPPGESDSRESFIVTMKLSGVEGVSPSAGASYTLVAETDGTYTLTLSVSIAEATSGSVPISLVVADNAFVGSQTFLAEIVSVVGNGTGRNHYEEPDFSSSPIITVDVADEAFASQDGPSVSLSTPAAVTEGTVLSFMLELSLPLTEIALREDVTVTLSLSGVDGLLLSGTPPAGITSWLLVGNILTMTIAEGCPAGNLPITLSIPDNYQLGDQSLAIAITGITGTQYEKPTFDATVKTVTVEDEAVADREGPVFSLEASTLTIMEGDSLTFGLKLTLPSGNTALREGYVLNLLLSDIEGLSLSGTLPAGIDAWSLTGSGPYILSLTLGEGLVSDTVIPLTMHVADNVFAGDQHLDIAITSAVGQGGIDGFRYEWTDVDVTPLSFTVTDDDLSGPHFSLSMNGPPAVQDGEIIAFDLNIALPSGETSCREDFMVFLALSGMEGIEAVGSEYTLVDQGGGSYTISLTVTSAQVEAGTIPLEIRTPAASEAGDQVLDVALTLVTGTGSGQNHYEAAQWGSDGALAVTVHDTTFHAFLRTMVDEHEFYDVLNAIAPPAIEWTGSIVAQGGVSLGEGGTFVELYNEHDVTVQNQLNHIDAIFSS